MLNQCTFIGRFTRDPMLRKTDTSSKSVVSFTIAVDRDRPSADGTWTADFIDCVAWERTAEKICEKFKKGDWITVTGRMLNRSIPGKDGQKHTVLELVVREQYKPTFGARASTTAQAPEIPETPVPDEDYAILDESDGQLPF